MDIVEWLLTESTIKRDFYNSFYFAMFIIMCIAIFAMFKAKLVKFSLLLWLVSAIINLLWEASLYLGGSRQYNFYAVIELLYHVLTEAGPGLIIMVIVAERLKIIDIKQFHDEAWKWKFWNG
ncbi:MAG: hypothetical protein JSV49_01620 [Thermoplasmata archaeon]|nr:MAG: hypothetical protein JSV49_01620 [Thermoplasmata archaeon]